MAGGPTKEEQQILERVQKETAEEILMSLQVTRADIYIASLKYRRKNGRT